MAPGSGPMTKNLYPFDVIQLTSANGSDEKKPKCSSNDGNKKRADLLKHLKLTELHTPVPQKNQPKSTVTQSFTVDFFAESSL